MSEVDRLITDWAEAQVKAVEASCKAFEDKVRQAEDLLTEVLGDAWKELRPFAERSVDRNCLFYTVRAVDLRLAPFKVWVDLHLMQVRLDNKPVRDFVEMLAEKREEFEPWQEKDLFNTTQVLVWKLNKMDEFGPALMIMHDLIALDPENAEKWRSVFANWQARYDNERRLEDEQKALEEAQAAAKLSYREEFKAFWIDYQAALDRNRVRGKALQERLNTPFEVRELTYAALVEKEWGSDDSNHMELLKVFVLSGTPDRDGYWQTLERGLVAPIKFFNPVSVSGPIEVTPEPVIINLSQSWWVEKALMWMHASPFVDLLGEIGKGEFEALPEKPEIPECLRERGEWIALIEREVKSELGPIFEEGF